MRDAEQVVDAGRVLNFPDYSSFQSLKQVHFYVALSLAPFQNCRGDATTYDVQCTGNSHFRNCKYL